MITIKYGTTHDDVKLLSSRLLAVGYGDSSVDLMSRVASSSLMYFVVMFQINHAHALVVDGVFGTKSSKVLEDLEFNLIGSPTDSITGDTILTEYGTVAAKYIRPKGLDNVTMYGSLPTGRLKTLVLPYDMFLSWDTDYKVDKISVNPLIHDDLLLALSEIKRLYTMDEIKALGLHLYGGCYNDRNTRGGTSKSTHSWAVSIDINPDGNKFGGKPKDAINSTPLAKKFMDTMLKYNFYTLSGDLMHFNWIDKKYVVPS